jgi:hypothetical protein
MTCNRSRKFLKRIELVRIIIVPIRRQVGLRQRIKTTHASIGVPCWMLHLLYLLSSAQKLLSSSVLLL